jgi:hypothetical protein
MAKPSGKLTDKGNVASASARNLGTITSWAQLKSLFLDIMTIRYNTIFESYQRKKYWYEEHLIDFKKKYSSRDTVACKKLISNGEKDCENEETKTESKTIEVL